MPGVGKTSIGKSLSNLFNLNCIDIDEQIEVKSSESINDIIQKKGEATFRTLEKRELKNTLQNKSTSIISTGGGIIIDDENRRLIKDSALGVHLKSTAEEIAKRIDVSKRPLLYNTNKIENLTQLWSKRQNLYKNAAKIEIDIKGLTIDEATKKIYSEIQNVCS